MSAPRALVLGLGKSGKSAALYLAQSGWQVFAVDRLADVEKNRLKLKALLPNCEVLGEQNLKVIQERLKSCLRVIISPGIDLVHPVITLARSLQIPLQSELELGAEAICRGGKAQTLIAVTGSNGKTTVVSWLEHVLCGLGIKAIAAGNIGRPLTSCVDGDSSRVIIVEISSFQLQAMHLPLFDFAALLNISPNHLDRHGNLSDYGQLKCKVQTLLRDKSRLLVSQSVDEEFGKSLQLPYRTFGARAHDTLALRGDRVIIEGQECEIGDLLGAHFEHDIQNLCAVLGIGYHLGFNLAEICSCARNFQKPHHRLEWICCHRDVDYYDDSKATSPDAVIKAVRSLHRPIILIAGGVSKKVSFEPWISPFADKVRKILAIGETAPQIVLQLTAYIPTSKCSCLDDAFAKAVHLAKAGDAILLSPGCSSFDMFENYQDRGRQFAALTKRLYHKEVTK